MQINRADAKAEFLILRPRSAAFPLRIGDVLTSEVLNVTASGTVSLRLAFGEGKSIVIPARTEMNLEKGMVIQLRVEGGNGELRLRFLGNLEEASPFARAGDGGLSGRILRILATLTTARLKMVEIRTALDMLRNLPPQVRAALPGIARLEGFFPAIEDLDSGTLRRAFEGSGILLERALGAIAEGGKQGGDALQLGETDLKGLLLLLRGRLGDRAVVEAMRSSGLNPADITETLEGLVKNIELFQISSRMNETLSTFLPVCWDELRDGDISFRREGEGGDSDKFTCTLHLDLDPIGMLGISVSLFEGAIYVSFAAERAETASLLQTAQGQLEERLSDAGLHLRAVNVTRRDTDEIRHAGASTVNVRI